MSRYLRLRILMLENRQQIDQGKTLRGSSCIRRFAIFIQSAFIADSDTMPVESTHMEHPSQRWDDNGEELRHG